MLAASAQKPRGEGAAAADADTGQASSGSGDYKARFAVGDAIKVEISNTGSLEPVSGTRRRRPGIGLANVRRRLELHYPGRHTFTLTERDNKVVVTLVLEGEPFSGS